MREKERDKKIYSKRRRGREGSSRGANLWMHPGVDCHLARLFNACLTERRRAGIGVPRRACAPLRMLGIRAELDQIRAFRAFIPLRRARNSLGRICWKQGNAFFFTRRENKGTVYSKYVQLTGEGS